MTTENGNLSYSSVGTHILDFYSGVTRQTTDEDIKRIFTAAYEEDPILSILALFHKRDCRGGAGERKPFIIGFSCLPQETRFRLYQIIPQYGYWDDLNKLARTIPEDQEYIISLWTKALIKNIKAFYGLTTDTPDYLVEKWIPSEGSSDDKAYHAVSAIIKSLKITLPVKPELELTEIVQEKYAKIGTKINHEWYRHWLSFVRAWKKLPESFKHESYWENIEYDKIASLAFQRSKKQFQKHDHARFLEFLAAVKKSEKVIHTGQLAPYELFSNLDHGDSTIIDMQWEQLLKDMSEQLVNGPFHPKNCIFVADVSGSMTSGTPTRISVALSLAIMGSTLGNQPLYTFSSTPNKYLPTWTSLSEAKEQIIDNNYSTNFKELINKLSQDDIKAQTLVILTDGGFNEMCRLEPTTGLDYARKLLGDQIQIVFWNVAGNVSDFMAQESSSGVCLVSGFSKDLYLSMMKLTNLSELNPGVFCRKTLFGERYLKIIELLQL